MTLGLPPAGGDSGDLGLIPEGDPRGLTCEGVVYVNAVGYTGCTVHGMCIKSASQFDSAMAWEQVFGLRVHELDTKLNVKREYFVGKRSRSIFLHWFGYKSSLEKCFRVAVVQRGDDEVRVVLDWWEPMVVFLRKEIRSGFFLTVPRIEMSVHAYRLLQKLVFSIRHVKARETGRLMTKQTTARDEAELTMEYNEDDDEVIITSNDEVLKVPYMVLNMAVTDAVNEYLPMLSY